jgi:hypothetical protein
MRGFGFPLMHVMWVIFVGIVITPQSGGRVAATHRWPPAVYANDLIGGRVVAQPSTRPVAMSGRVWSPAAYCFQVPPAWAAMASARAGA